jgi:branched-chain amino acid aminotransferase
VSGAGAGSRGAGAGPSPRGRVVLIDGALTAPEGAAVSVYDRGFLFGDAVFEVLRTYGGVPFALDEHFARLRRSAVRVFIELPVDDATLRGEVERGIAAAQNDESYVRVIVTRGSGPVSLDPGTAGRPLRVILVEPVVPPAREVYASGIATITIATRRSVDDTAAAGAKVSNYLESLLAVREAKARGAQEALIVDARGEVVEGATSNVFMVKGGRVTTPPVEAGILAGITRAHVLDVAAKTGVAADERRLRPEDLYGADEVFVTSSIRELVPVVRVDGREVGTGAPGPVARALHRAFRVAVGVADRPMPWADETREPDEKSRPPGGSPKD